MRRLVAFVVILVMSPSLARAEDECVTTTRCTGAAAPYAAQPQLQQQLQPPTLIVEERPGWHLAYDEAGVLWREHKVSAPRASVWGTGLALFAVSYAAGATHALINDRPWGLIPVFGAFTDAAVESFSNEWEGHHGNQTAAALLGIDAIAQIGGMVTFFVGLAAGEKLERERVQLGGGPLPGGGAGVSASGRF